MSKARKSRTRRHRRDIKKVLKFGPSAKATHKLKSGRTGRARTKKLQSLK